jgi:hypothetical protein
MFFPNPDACANYSETAYLSQGWIIQHDNHWARQFAGESDYDKLATQLITRPVSSTVSTTDVILPTKH